MQYAILRLSHESAYIYHSYKYFFILEKELVPEVNLFSYD